MEVNCFYLAFEFLLSVTLEMDTSISYRVIQVIN